MLKTQASINNHVSPPTSTRLAVGVVGNTPLESKEGSADIIAVTGDVGQKLALGEKVSKGGRNDFCDVTKSNMLKYGIQEERVDAENVVHMTVGGDNM